MRNLFAACGLAAGAVLSAVSPAAAHSYLTASTPGGGTTTTTPPDSLTLTFSEELEAKLCSVTVRDAAGHSENGGPIALAAGSQTVLQVPVKKLGAGTYTVTWHATSTDTHKTQGSYSFTVIAPDND